MIRRSRILVTLITVFLMATVSCTGGTSSDDCSPACAAGARCVDGSCVELCNSDSDCGAKHSCVDGGCVMSGCVENIECDDSNPCTADSCGSAGCEHFATVGVCDDGDACTSNDACVTPVFAPGRPPTVTTVMSARPMVVIR